VAGASHGHHLIPKISLLEDAWNAAENLVAMDSKLHGKLHSLMRDWGKVEGQLAIYGPKMAKNILPKFETGEKYVAELRKFYTHLDGMEEFKGILAFFEQGAAKIKASDFEKFI